jgi:hypothetical protein
MSIEVQRAELQRILGSPQFRRAPKLRRFLELICEYHFEDKSEEISEYLLATVVFGKNERFDRAEDSLVRVQAREVRRRLREYYQNEGRASRVVLDLPTGSYSPVFTTQAAPSSVRRLPAIRTAWVMVAATALVCAALLFAADRERRLMLVSAAGNGTNAGPSPPVARLWNRFLDSNVSTVLVVSNPSVGGCREMPPKGKAPGADCVEEYTGMGEAVAVHLFTNLFRSARQTLIVKPSRMVNEDDIKRYNLILLGGKQVNVWTERLAPDLTLKASAEDLSGEQAAQYATRFDQQTGQLTHDRGIIALRRDATGHWVMVIYGKHSQGTRAAAEAAADARFLSQLRWPQTQFPDSFRVLVGVSVNDGIPQEPVPVAVRVP